MKTIFLAAGAALCLLSVTSCSNDGIENPDLQSGPKVLMTMQTTGPSTRADYTDAGTSMAFSWRSGDEMSVVVSGVAGNDNCQLTSNSDGKSVPFSGSVTGFSGTQNIYAFYPYSSHGYTVTGSSTPSTATAALTLPNPQSYTVNGALSNSFMVGVGTATASGTAIDASASLKQVMSIIRLNISNAPAKVIGVKLRLAEALFPTTATVRLSDATISNPGSFANKLSMAVTDGTAGTSKDVSLAMFPVDLTGKTISVEVTFEGGLIKSIDKPGLAFVANKFYVISFDGSNAVAANYIEPDGFGRGLEWAVGNLVADGAGARIGSSTDNGLYFQFGSLVGWSDTGAPTVAISPSGYSGPTTWTPNWTGDPTTEDVSTGTGDACTYYLGNGWRLPTNDEYSSLFNHTTSGWAGTIGWSWSSASAVHTSGLRFPASGYRLYTDGSLAYTGANGYCWSSSPNNASNGYTLYFGSSNVRPSYNGFRAVGYPVRCVRANN